MRLITVAFPSAAEFLASYEDGTFFIHTRTDAQIGEAVLAELSFPGLPNRSLVRAVVETLRIGVDNEGLTLRIDDKDAATRDFVVRLARGELRIESTTHREHKRFPAALPVSYTIDETPGMVASLVDDLGAGGCFVRAQTPPAVGTKVSLRISAPDGGDICVDGLVAWTRHDEGSGFGVDFEPASGDDGRRLRSLLRKAQESGEVDLERNG